MGGIRQLGRAAVVNGELAGVERGGAELALLVDGVENDVEARLAVGREPPLLGHRDHPLQRLEARIGRLHAAPHLLDGEEPAAHFDIGLAEPGRPRGADVVVGVLAGPDDGGIAHAAGDLERDPGRRRHRRDVAVRRDGVAVDRAGRPRDHRLPRGDVEVGVVGIEVGAPMQPCLARRVGEQVLFLEAVLEREVLRPFADQEDVIGVLEDALGDLGRCLDPLEATHRAGAARGAVHARRVELHHALGVGQPAVAHRGIVRVELLDLHGLDRGIERVCPLQHQVERFLHAAQSVGAGDDDRLRDPTRRGRQGERGAHRVRNGGGREPARGGGDEIPTRQDVGHGAWF